MKTRIGVGLIMAMLGACTASEGEESPARDCNYLGEPLAHEAQLETADGCVLYECQDSFLDPIRDDRVNVPDALELATQEDVAANVCLQEVGGVLTISGKATDLTPLAQLTHVGGLEVVAGDLVTMEGMVSLAQVDGNIVVADNPNLTTLSFPPYMSAFGDVSIENNDALVSLAGLGFVALCPSCSGAPVEAQLDPDQDPHRDAAPGFGGDEGGNGGTFFGSIVIADNDVLVDIQALAGLASVWADLRFRSNAALESLDAMMMLLEVRGDFEITNHPSMEQLYAEDFALGITIVGQKRVCGNSDGEACP